MEADAASGTLHPGRPRALAVALEVATSTWFLGALVFVATWGGGLVSPVEPSIDHSFHAGLNMAAVHGLDFGSDIVVTYGPLGFLKSYLVFFPGTARLAVAYGFALHLALCISLVWALRRNFGVLIAVVVALAIAALARGDLSAVAVRDDAAVVVLAFIWCAAALSDDSPAWTRKLVVYGGGPFAAIEVLAKLNPGALVLALVAITVVAIGEQRRQNLAILAAGFVGTLGVLWFASGQGLDDVGGYIGGSLDLVTGYSSGARFDYGFDQREYDYVLTPLVFGAAGAIAWISTRGLNWGRRAPLLLMTALVTFTAAKGGFVSHDIFHMAAFYATVAGVCVAFSLPDRGRIRVGALAAIVAATVAGLTTEFPGYPLTNPLENARNGVETVATMIDGGRLEAEVNRNREAAIASYDVDPRGLELLDGQTVAVDPSEVAVAWANDLDWRPLPVFQPYMAWTEDLDRRNAEALVDDDGPQRILRQNLNALGRYPAFESPAAMLAMLCNFEARWTTHEWQVLERVPDRCGEPYPIGRAEGTYGTPFAVPRPPAGNVVFAEVNGIEVAGLERLRAALVRSRGRQVTFENDGRLYTFIAATAGDGLLLRAPPSIDYPEPFGLAPNEDEVTFLYEGGPADKRLTVDFFAMPVRPARGPAPGA